jgi:hypothetical protein
MIREAYSLISSVSPPGTSAALVFFGPAGYGVLPKTERRAGASNALYCLWR